MKKTFYDKFQKSVAEAKLNRRIHTELHDLVDKLRKDFGETAKKGVGSFSYYLGLLKRVPISTLYTWIADIKDSPRLITPLSRAKIFWWKFGQWNNDEEG